MAEDRETRVAERGRGDHGFALIMTALVIVPLMLVAAFAVDMGGWYAKASRAQRAADAAALAGVVWMPTFSKAEAVARDTAEKNGFEHDPDGSGVIVNVWTSGEHQLSVSITADGEVYLGKIVRSDGVQITRDATAEYALPVPLGSPKNTFGTGDLLDSANREHFWAAVNGYCAGHESGDLKLARYESYSREYGAAAHCNNGSAETDDYDEDGYLYAIELPQSAPGGLSVQIYDAGYNNSGSASDLNLAREAQNVRTIYEFYATDSTPLDRTDNPLSGAVTIETDNTTYKNQWRTLHKWNTAPAGIYYIRVRTAAQTSESRGSNGFGIRAHTGSSFAMCTSIAGPSYSANCPQVHGVDDMSIFANFDGSTAAFYLADVAPVHAGKTMRVSLFDSGEGAESIEVLDPNGNPVSFNWSTPCDPPTPPTGGCSGTTTKLNVSGKGTQPYPSLSSESKYNDRAMVLDIALPDNYSTLYGSKRWWRIRYDFGAEKVTDRTTWSVQIIGDPVHLVD